MHWRKLGRSRVVSVRMYIFKQVYTVLTDAAMLDRT